MLDESKETRDPEQRCRIEPGADGAQWWENSHQRSRLPHQGNESYFCAACPVEYVVSENNNMSFCEGEN